MLRLNQNIRGFRRDKADDKGRNVQTKIKTFILIIKKGVVL